MINYFLTFLEGILTFISPCILPLLPVYISYFSGDSINQNKRKTFFNALAFVLGFTATFVALGAFAGSFGYFLAIHKKTISIIAGIIIMIFGLSFAGLFNLKIFGNGHLYESKGEPKLVSAFSFGIVFAVSFTPCIGAFLGSALLLAGAAGTAVKGIALLLSFSLGLGVPFLISAILINVLQDSFNFIKKHYKAINIMSGLVLIIMGALMIFNVI